MARKAICPSGSVLRPNAIELAEYAIAILPYNFRNYTLSSMKFCSKMNASRPSGPIRPVSVSGDYAINSHYAVCCRDEGPRSRPRVNWHP
jgi:hypothetical protein